MTTAEQPQSARAPSLRPSVDIDLPALCANYRTLKTTVQSADVAAVVKCNAYGLGVEKVADALVKYEDCRRFFVAYPHEGEILRAALPQDGVERQIFVFNGVDDGSLSLFKQCVLIPVLNTVEQARLWADACPGAPAALHVDTGMSRLAMPPDDLRNIKEIDGLNIVVLMSHLACGSSPQDDMNERQRAAFTELAANFPQAEKSLAASAGALMGSAYHFDLVRPGIALYGGSPFPTPDARLQPVVTLKAPIIQLQTAQPGQSVGYDATYRLEEKALLATVLLGYGDGYPRGGGNKAKVFIGGEFAPIVGRVSMDLISLDVTNIGKPLQVGDHVEVFGPNLDITEVASACGAIPYEMITGLGERIDRHYVYS